MWPFSFSEMSLETANRLSNIANVALVLSLIVGFLSTIVVVITGNIKESHWDELREEGKKEVARLGLQTAKAQENAAIANERAATLNTALENERKKRLPRRLSVEQIAILEEMLSKEKRTFFVVSKHEDESMQYAQQFVDLLSKHKLLESYVMKGIYTDGSGLRIYIPLDGNTPHEIAKKDPIAKAFISAEITGNISWGATPPNPGFPENATKTLPNVWRSGHPVIWIGEKPASRD